MIHIEKDQEILDEKNFRIFTTTGDYEDSALIEFYDIEKPEIIAGSFQAQYIKYGNLVYKFSDPKELGEEILKIDPESTHTAASYVRMTNELLQKMNQGSLEPESLDEVITSEQEIMKEKKEEEIEEEEQIISTPIPDPIPNTITDPKIVPEQIIEPISDQAQDAISDKIIETSDSKKTSAFIHKKKRIL